MSSALFCDRCGGMEKPSSYEGWMAIRTDYYSKCGDLDQTEHFDLCIGCTAMFVRLLAKMEHNKESYRKECANCAFFLEQLNEKDGFCLRYPAKSSLVLGTGSWCGEWKPESWRYHAN